jgi:serine/threonine-protein kinase
MTLVISSGNEAPADTQAADTAQATDTSQAAASGEVWKCTQSLNTPTGYQGGLIRLELVQEVNGTPTASTILEGQALQFPYQLNITGAPGVESGTVVLYEEINGSYQNLGQYPITFKKAE